MLSRSLARQAPLRAATAQMTLRSSARSASTAANSSSKTPKENPEKTTTISTQDSQPAKKKTLAELDEELELKMQGLSGDGGEYGVELEDGQPVAMKRSVKNNMFRYI